MSQKKTIPAFSPLLAPEIVCQGCGDIIKPQIIKSNFGGVQAVKYDHTNEEVGCNYTVESNHMIVGEMRPRREDGTPVKL